MNYLHLIEHWFNQLSRARKISLAVTSTIILLATLLLCWWAITPNYAVLFNHVDERDANHILSQLDEAQIDYQLRNGGRDILIDERLIAKTRLKIMSSGMHLAASVGFELFDKNDFGMTDFSQKINFQRALQGELERTISSIDEVQYARVHLVIPESHLFDKEMNKPKAAVTLHLKKPLTSKQVDSIQHLVMASVNQLDKTQVIIVDQNSTTLSANDEDSATNQFTTKKSIEHYLANKARDMLRQVVPQNQFTISVDAAINYDELQKELVKPQSQGLVSHEKEIKHSAQGKTDKDKSNQDSTLEKSYQLGSEKELFKRARGTIERLTISVVLPQTTSQKTIEQITRIIKTSVGFNDARGDTISIEALITPPQTFKKAPMPVVAQTEHMSISNSLLFLFAAMLTLSASMLIVLRRAQLKKRQLLFVELTQWLDHHE
ncbi:MAG: flagellar basal-body MS-ring/collar protein FliF [Legionella sp.]